MVTMAKLNVDNPEHVEEMRALVSSGDVNLEIAKAEFKKRTGKATILSDEDLLIVHASQDDDYGMTDMVRRMEAAEAGQPLCWEGEQPY